MVQPCPKFSQGRNKAITLHYAITCYYSTILCYAVQYYSMYYSMECYTINFIIQKKINLTTHTDA